MNPSKEGVLRLADLLIHNINHYLQRVFVNQNECGTICCMAGLCYANEIGVRKFNSIAKKIYEEEGPTGRGRELTTECVLAGERLLGLLKRYSPQYGYGFPDIFSDPTDWPMDLMEEYGKASSNKERVIAALKALSRMDARGEIQDHVITEIPQLKKLQEGKYDKQIAKQSKLWLKNSIKNATKTKTA